MTRALIITAFAAALSLGAAATASANTAQDQNADAPTLITIKSDRGDHSDEAKRIFARMAAEG